MSYNNTISKTEAKFMVKLRQAAEDIRKEARGRTCEMCLHYLRTLCMRPDLEDDVEIHTPQAVACNRFVAKVDKKRAHHRR